MRFLVCFFSLLMFVEQQILFGTIYELSLGCAFQNEGPYLKEWIDYYKEVGVQHFYLYNNESTDNFREVLEPYIQEETVELIDWPTKTPHLHWGNGDQLAAYRDLLARARTTTIWLAIVDSDEFILPMEGTNILALLNNYPLDVGAVYLNWLQFGTGGITCDSSAILTSLVKCAETTHEYCAYGKTIVRMAAVESVKTPHWCILKNGFLYYNGDGDLYEPTQIYGNDKCHHEKLMRINHYVHRDEFYFRNWKIPRYVKWRRAQTAERLNESFSKKTDTKMLELLQNLDRM